MEWLNYHHLLYFWVVAKEGSIVRASEELRPAHPYDQRPDPSARRDAGRTGDRPATPAGRRV